MSEQLPTYSTESTQHIVAHNPDRAVAHIRDLQAENHTQERRIAQLEADKAALARRIAEQCLHQNISGG